MLSSLKINISSLLMLHLPLLLLFFLILRMCRLLSGSSLELCMKDVDQLCHFLRLTHHLILLLRLLLSLLLISLLFVTLREYLILLISMVFLLLYPLLLFHHVTHKLSSLRSFSQIDKSFSQAYVEYLSQNGFSLDPLDPPLLPFSSQWDMVC